MAGPNYQRNGTHWDVVDWPEPGDWPGSVYRHHGGPWFADVRVRDGVWRSVEGRFDTRREATDALLRAVHELTRPEFLGPWVLRRGHWRRPFKLHWRQESFDGELTRSEPEGLSPMIDSGPNVNWIAVGWHQAWIHGPEVKAS